MQRGVWLPIGRVLLDLPRRVLTGVVLGYRLLLKPWLGNACRFEPTCSAYALQALQRHGALGGSALTGWRILRCQPWCQGGCDPVPDNFPHPVAGLFTRLRGEPQVSAQLRDDLEQQPSPPPALPDNTSVTRKIP